MNVIQLYGIVTVLVAMPLGYMTWLVQRNVKKLKQGIINANLLHSKVFAKLESTLDVPTPEAVFRPPVRCSKCNKVVARYSTSDKNVHTCVNCK